MTSATSLRTIPLGSLVLIGALLLPAFAAAHCDALDGPVVADARIALDRGDVTPALKWVREQDEPEIRVAFTAALAQREADPESADTRFFETLVRVHRRGEGAPFTGLRPAGSELEPGVREADHALETASVDPLLDEIAHRVDEAIRSRHERVLETRQHADASVEAGREYVEAYTEYIHFVMRLFEDVASPAGHGVPGEAHAHGTDQAHGAAPGNRPDTDATHAGHTH